jgi:hypothetical protein
MTEPYMEVIRKLNALTNEDIYNGKGEFEEALSQFAI